MILKLKNIQLSFTDSRGETFNLLNGVNLDVKRETVTVLVGGNGTGKTTLFNVISGFTDDFKGEILFDNLSLKGMAPHKISRLGIGRLFQGRQLIDDLSLMENMKIASVNRDGENPLTALFRQGQHRRTEQEKEEQAITMYNPQIQISAESETKRSIFREKDKTKRSKKESAQHSKSRNKSFVMTSVSAL